MFPGLYRPGLIEACGMGGIGLFDGIKFPGLYRPGLIEAMARRRHRRAMRDSFRGFTAPASLKPTAMPGATKPAVGVSGALPPRPH